MGDDETPDDVVALKKGNAHRYGHASEFWLQVIERTAPKAAVVCLNWGAEPGLLDAMFLACIIYLVTFGLVTIAGSLLT